MASNDFQTVVDRKNHMRRAAYDARNAQSNKDELSKIICDKFISLPEYLTADTIMWYVDVRSEVRTRPQLIDALKGDKRIVVPYCVDDVLHLWWLQGIDELVQGMWKILEPPKQRWGRGFEHGLLGGRRGTRTPDQCLVRAVLYQLSYAPANGRREPTAVLRVTEPRSTQ